MSRNYRFDNIKFILITLVVFGHFLELIDGQTAKSLYRVIYLFHIPAFIFVTGYFAKFNPSKIMRNLIIPYVILQLLYLPYNNLFILEKDTFTLQFTKPYWLLWYLMTVSFYYLLIPFFETGNRQKQLLIVGASATVSLLAGFDENIGYFLSLSRFFSFLPFFLAGYYFAKTGKADTSSSKKELSYIPTAIAAAGVVFSIIYIINSPIRYQVLYGSYSYEAMTYGPGIKFLLMLFASCWITLLLYVIPNKKVPVISIIGKNTFTIFVLHGFFIKLTDKLDLFIYTETQNLLFAFLLTGTTLILLGNKYIASFFEFILCGFHQKRP